MPPVLPPKKKSLNKKPIPSRASSGSVPSMRASSGSSGPSSFTRQRVNRYSSVDSSRSATSGTNDDECVGSLIARSSKSDKLEKRLSKKVDPWYKDSKKREHLERVYLKIYPFYLKVTILPLTAVALLRGNYYNRFVDMFVYHYIY
eukprot:sb/3473864/